MTSRATGQPTGPQLTTLGYQPAIDGVRFVGMTAFVLGHAGVMTNQRQLIPFGWWMAVDTFFVVSGFLITTLLLRERATNGRISLKAFYIRRASRLYPLVAVVVIISICQQLLRPESTATPSWSSIFSMTFYYANFQQLLHPADMYNSWSPLWSLSIEEQFYLIWPLLLILLLGRNFNLKRPLVAAIAIAIAISSFRTISWLGRPTSGTAAQRFIDETNAWHTFYFSSFHRPDGLLIGCATAIILAMPRNRIIQSIVTISHRLRYLTVLGAITIVVIGSYGNSGWEVCWGLTLYNLIVAMIVIELLEYRDSYLVKTLSWRPLLWIGRRSYGIYVIHLALLMVLVRVLGLTSLPWIFICTAVIFAVSGISYRFYEDPIRRRGYTLSKRILQTDSR